MRLRFHVRLSTNEKLLPFTLLIFHLQRTMDMVFIFASCHGFVVYSPNCLCQCLGPNYIGEYGRWSDVREAHDEYITKKDSEEYSKVVVVGYSRNLPADLCCRNSSPSRN